MVLKIHGLTRYFERGDTRFTAVDGVNLEENTGVSDRRSQFGERQNDFAESGDGAVDSPTG